MPSSYQLWTRRSVVNYSRFIGREIELMQMPSMIESPRQDAGQAPQMRSHRYRRLRRWKSVFVDASGGLGIYVNIQEEDLGYGVTEGPQGRGRALHPCGRLVALLTCTLSLLGVFWSKKNHRGSFIPFGLHLVFLSCETQKQGKTETGTGLQVNKLVPKII